MVLYTFYIRWGECEVLPVLCEPSWVWGSGCLGVEFTVWTGTAILYSQSACRLGQLEVVSRARVSNESSAAVTTCSRGRPASMCATGATRADTVSRFRCTECRKAGSLARRASSGWPLGPSRAVNLAVRFSSSCTVRIKVSCGRGRSTGQHGGEPLSRRVALPYASVDATKRSRTRRVVSSGRSANAQ